MKRKNVTHRTLELPLREYVRFLKLEKGLSKHSIAAYSSDLHRLAEFLDAESVRTYEAV
ncbi:MAG: site-specific integrase, partial [Candidatus Kapaibacterium sp.]